MAGRSVLVVEDDLPLQRYLLRFFSDRGYHSILVPTLAEAGDALLRSEFRFTVVDVASHADCGFEAASRLKSHAGHAGSVIALADPRDVTERLNPPAGVDRIISKASLELDLGHALASLADDATPAADAIVGSSASVPRELTLWKSRQMHEVRKVIVEAAAVDVTVLIRGETGTGKGVVARAIHALSSRCTGPFVELNCAAVPRELLESELFGHERGAFTGAHKLKIGKFEAAHNGTIFLDEIGDLHPAVQAKLLHVLQDGDLSRVGGNAAFKVSTRVVAATNQNLERRVADGGFREDLYYRLNVIQIVVPPLRERLDDIPALAQYFVERYSKLFRREPFSIPPAVMAQLLQQRYRGNVRELENLIKRMVILGDTGLDGAAGEFQERPEKAPAPPKICLKDIVRHAARTAERDAIRKVLEQNGWNRTRAARALNISYRGLLYKIDRVGLRAELIGRRPSLPRTVEGLDGSAT